MTTQTNIDFDRPAGSRRARVAARGRGLCIHIAAILCASGVYIAAGRVVPAADAIPIPPHGPPSCLGSFQYTGTEVACAVPPGITALHIVAAGGSGGNGGAWAGAVQRDLSGVYGGERFFIYVGGNGGSPAGGWNGGGNGGGLAGGGGGASDVRQDVDDLEHRVVVAAGGGGGGQALNGAGGGLGGSAWVTADGGAGGTVGSGGGGGGGTQNAGGAGGGNLPVLSGPGLFGGFGSGGAGGAASAFPPPFPQGAGGGAGGGGYFGGGGGGGDIGPGGGGGAGSNYPAHDVVTPPQGVIAIPGPPGVTISAPVPLVSNPPTIGGTAVQGELVSESHATWANGPVSSYSYQWLRCNSAGANCVPIPGETSQVYRVTAADVGSALAVTEAVSNFYGASAPAQSAATAPIVSAVPANTRPPTIDGPAVEGQSLSEVDGSWTNNPFSHSYQWARCDTSGSHCVQIPGATGQTYASGPADVGSTLAVSDTAHNSVGASAPVRSDATSPVKSAVPVNVAAPTVVGPAVAGQTLAVQRGVWANAPATFQYQWLRCDGNGAGCQPIGGQTGLGDTLTGQDVGSTIKVQEVAVNGYGAGPPASSLATGPVVDALLTVQAYALVGTTGSIVPGPVASFSQYGASHASPGSYSATISWGDGTSTQGAVLQGRLGNYLVDASHAYAKVGNYTLAVRVTAATGAAAQSTNRVSVFAAAVCPKASAAKGRNCLGEISLPAGCLAPGAGLHVAIPPTGNIRSVHYAIDDRTRWIAGAGPRFAASLPTAGLTGGTHRLTARIAFRSGRPPRLAKTRRFAICGVT
jgi:hypothetical protein